MQDAVVVGAGQIGREAWHHLLYEGFGDVRVLARSKARWIEDEAVSDRFDCRELGDGPPLEADVVFDTIAFDAVDIARYDPDRVGHLVLISSASVYCDTQGRTLDEARDTGWPEFGGPITEDNPTVAPGPKTYSTRKVRMEEQARAMFGDRVTILRPGAIYGTHSKHPREWWFVKRLLDNRPRIPLIYRGASRFQATSACDIAFFGVWSAKKQVGGTYNIGDCDCPTVAERGRVIARHLGREVEFVPIDDATGTVGRTPWSVGRPLIVSSEKLTTQFPYKRESMTYERQVTGTVDWLRGRNPADWRAAFPQLAAYPWDMFDYAAEDRFLEGR